MAIIWQTICELFSKLVRPSRRKTRVTFSPSTLHREIIRHTKLTATVNPFFNFLAEVRVKAMTDSVDAMTSRDYARLAKTAGHMWNCMSDDEKQPYRNIAMELKKVKRLRGRRTSSWYTKSAKRRRKRRQQKRLAEEKLKKTSADSNGDG